MNLSQRIKNAREARDISLNELSSMTGITKSSLQRYETASTKKVPVDAISKIEKALNLPSGHLMGWSASEESSLPDNIITFDKFKQIPIIGRIACGEPILAEENIEGHTTVAKDFSCDFGLICKGDSMSPKFLDGDVVLIRKQPTVENGQIAAVIIGEEAMLKRVYVDSEKIVLSPENLSFAPLVYQGEQMNSIRIVGLAVGYTRLF